MGKGSTWRKVKRGSSNSGTRWKHGGGWDEDNTTDHGRQHTRTAVEQLVSHESPSSKEDEERGRRWWSPECGRSVGQLQVCRFVWSGHFPKQQHTEDEKWKDTCSNLSNASAQMSIKPWMCSERPRSWMCFVCVRFCCRWVRSKEVSRFLSSALGSYSVSPGSQYSGLQGFYFPSSFLFTQGHRCSDLADPLIVQNEFILLV